MTILLLLLPPALLAVALYIIFGIKFEERWWVRLIYFLGLRDAVWTRDHDGEVRLRTVRSDPWGKRTCFAIARSTVCVLNDDGTVDNCYVTSWKPYRGWRLFGGRGVAEAESL